MTTQVVILAAGQGKRMKSHLPKVLHTLAGKPLLQHVIHTARKVSDDLSPIVIYGHQGEILQTKLLSESVTWVNQSSQLGTGHALLQAMPLLIKDNQILVLYGDVPLISSDTLTRLLSETPNDAIGMITAHLSNPHGYGRIKRDGEHQVLEIIEEKDATVAERNINEINSGIYLIPQMYLAKWLPQLSNTNAQDEYYLTEVIALAVQAGVKIHTVQPKVVEEIFGVNQRSQLAELERFYQQQYAEKLMHDGVTLRDPARIDIRGEAEIAQDVIIDVNVILEGRVVVGAHSIIGPNCFLKNVTIGQHVEIKANTVIEDADVGDDAIIGPFARIRPGTILADKTHIGNFVEIKNSVIGVGSKVNHLSYIGDSEIGKKVNIGAGTITCNYDGVNKHKTIIKDDVFIGSNTALVAPVIIEEGATVGAGSTITLNAPAHQLTVGRAKQVTIPHWVKPVKSAKTK